MKPFTVLVVDDSAFMRKMISDIIMEDPLFEVICTANNGAEAIEKVKECKPDLITMDVEMPVMNGLEALEIIMRDDPTPVVMLSSLTSESTKVTLQALDNGAIDFVKKPSGEISFDLYKIKSILLEKLRIAIETKPMSITANASIPLVTSREVTTRVGNQASFDHIVVIGTSTGGPKALQTVITQLPESFPAPILIVQHMPPKFTKSLAERLQLLSKIDVVEAEEGSTIKAGTAYIAPGGWHMSLVKEGRSNYRIRLSKEAARNGHRPSVDVLFESLVPFSELTRHSVIMTGMGSDGAKGMKALKEAGADSTIAESKESCIVYGMPRAAIESGAAKFILPLKDIPAKVIELVHN